MNEGAVLLEHGQTNTFQTLIGDMVCGEAIGVLSCTGLCWDSCTGEVCAVYDFGNIPFMAGGNIQQDET